MNMLCVQSQVKTFLQATVMSWLKESHEIENVHKNLRIVSFQVRI